MGAWIYIGKYGIYQTHKDGQGFLLTEMHPGYIADGLEKTKERRLIVWQIQKANPQGKEGVRKQD